MSKLIVLTDLGTFKAYRLKDDQYSSNPRLEEVDAVEFVNGDDRISRRLSDQAGRFTKDAPGFQAAGDMSNGERHNILLENERRGVKDIAGRISDLLNNPEFESCYLAASNEINNAILEQLPSQAKSKIEKNLRCNLVNAPRNEILQQFA